MSRYTPKKKRPEPVIQPMRLVRVDHRTQIEVPIEMSDEDAIHRFYKKHTDLRNPNIHALTKASEIEDDEVLEDIEPEPDDEDDE